jgi:hypothetical protein
MCANVARYSQSRLGYVSISGYEIRIGHASRSKMNMEWRAMHDHGRNLKAPYQIKRTVSQTWGWHYELCAPSGRVVSWAVSREPVPPPQLREYQERLNTRAVLDLGWKPSTQQAEGQDGSARTGS